MALCSSNTLICFLNPPFSNFVSCKLLHNLHLRSKGMVLTNFSGTGVGFGFGIGCGFGVGWGFGGFPLHMLGLGVGGGCGVGLGLGWGFGAAFGSQYRTNKITFQGIDFNEKGLSDGKTIKD